MCLRALGIVAALSLPLPACGTEPSERDTREVVDRFQAALARSDGGSACAQLTPTLGDALEDQEGEPCDAAVLELGLVAGGRGGRSRVYLTSALVDVPGRGAIFLDETSHGWRISAAGCTRDGEQYECELED